MRGVNNQTQQKHWNSKVPKRAHLSVALLSVTSLFLLGGVKQSHTGCQRFLLALQFRSVLIPHITTYLRLAGVRLTHLTQMHTDTHLHAQASNLGQSTIKISTKSWAPPWRCKKKKTIQTALECPEGRYSMVAWLHWSWAHTHTNTHAHLCMSFWGLFSFIIQLLTRPITKWVLDFILNSIIATFSHLTALLGCEAQAMMSSVDLLNL